MLSIRPEPSPARALARQKQLRRLAEKLVNCRFCQLPLTPKPDQEFDGDGFLCDCPRCGIYLVNIQSLTGFGA